MIDQLLQVEIYLGNVSKGLEWSSERLESVLRKVYAEEKGAITEDVAEILFARIVKGLRMEGVSDDLIAEYMNARIGYKGGPKYCDASDVKAILS
jgi:hypothetical protein